MHVIQLCARSMRFLPVGAHMYAIHLRAHHINSLEYILTMYVNSHASKLNFFC